MQPNRTSGQALARETTARRTPPARNRSRNSLMITAASRTKRKPFAVERWLLQLSPLPGGEICRVVAQLSVMVWLAGD